MAAGQGTLPANRRKLGGVKPVHQLLASAVPGDAVTDQAFAWRTVLRWWGHRSEIYAEHVHPALAGQVRSLARSRLLEGDVVVLHYAVWSQALERFLDAPGPRVLCYHNVTPGNLLREHNSALADLCDRARAALSRLRGRCAVVVADSEFNARDLLASGIEGATTVPLILNLPTQIRRLDGGPGPVILSVGRLAPNKRVEDSVRAFALYQRCYSEDATLVHVGPYHEFDAYRRQLERLAERLGARSVRFTGRVSRDERDGWYRRADAYICSSIHEGFCAPVVEAIANGVPVVARAAGAVPETLGAAGIVLDDDDPALYTEALHELVSSRSTRAVLARAAERRLGELAPASVAGRLRSALEPVLNAA
jgi:glycosyltransferase involved in cell wall biosynthesis